MGIATGQNGYPSKFIINEESAGADKYFSTNKAFDYNDLLIANGNHIKDYTDLTKAASNFYSAHSKTLSDMTSPLYDYIEGNGGVEEVDNNFVRWRIYSKPDRRAISMGNPNQEDACYGGGGIPFKIRLDVDWFTKNDLLAPHRNKRCIVVVQSDCKFVGGAYEYDVIMLARPEYADVFPTEYFKEGDYWIKMGTITSDMGGNNYGSIQFGMNFSYIEFEVPMTTMQWKFSVKKDAHEKWGNLELTRCDEEGRPTLNRGKITNFLELEAMAQIKREKELYLKYGTATDHLLDDTTGERMTTGPGLDEFLEEGNVINYPVTTQGLDLVVDTIQSYWFDRVPVGQRKLVLYTGQGGLNLFHEWIEQKFGQTAVVTPHDFVLEKASAIVNGQRKAYAFGNFQFTKYYLPVFGEITVAHWPMLDNTRLNGVTMPGTPYPVSSYEFIAMEYGAGKPNIKLLRRKSEELTLIQPGLWSPFGKVGAKNPLYKAAYDPNFWGYHWIHRCSFGIVVMDPTRVLKFLPAVSCH